MATVGRPARQRAMDLPRRWLFSAPLDLAVFWRALAYLAVFHFIRQQYGWVMLYRVRGGERGRAGRWLDGATVYAATLYPLIV